MSDARNHTGPKLQRVAFTTWRLAEFCGAKELTAQTGHAPAEWLLVVAKELIDNALDAAEESEIAPEIRIEVSTERDEIVVADNGPGCRSKRSAMCSTTAFVSARARPMSRPPEATGQCPEVHHRDALCARWHARGHSNRISEAGPPDSVRDGSSSA